MLVVPQDVADKLPESLKAKAKVLGNGEKADVAGVAIEATAMYNTTPDRTKFHPKAVATAIS